MSEENAIPEVAPVEVPATPVVEDAAGPNIHGLGPDVGGGPNPDYVPPVAEVPNVDPAAPASVAESAPAPLTPVETVATLAPEISRTLHDLFQYIHEGFDQHSLMIGMSRFYDIARAVKAQAES
jgi:hypothetical protein